MQRERAIFATPFPHFMASQAREDLVDFSCPNTVQHILSTYGAEINAKRANYLIYNYDTKYIVYIE